MLKLPHSFHFNLPRLSPPNESLVFSPIPEESDELLAAIEADHERSVITLESVPNIGELERFWSGVEADLKNDPEWYDFA